MRKGNGVLAAVVLSGLAWATMGSIYAQSDLSARFGIRRPGRGGSQNPGFGNAGRPSQPAQVNQFSEVEYIGKEVAAGEKVKLGNAFNLQRDHAGQEVETIKVDVVGLRRAGKVTLLVNGKKAGQSKDFNGRQSATETIKWTLPNKELIVGDNLKSLQLQFDRRVFVMEAQLDFKEELAPAPVPRPSRPFVVNVQHDFYGETNQSVAALISANYDQYVTKTSQVALMIDGPSFRGSAQLCSAARAWDCGAMKTVSFNRRLLELDAPFGSKVGELMLKTRGQFSIKQVVVYPQR